MMSLTASKLASLWEKLKRFRTLFSDLTRGDVVNFVNFVTSSDTFWLEILEAERLVGLVVLEDMGKIIDVEAHVLFMDRDLSNKVPVCKAIVKWLFTTFPFQRLTVQIPETYMAPVRLVNEIGFKREGKKRRAVLISGKWVDVFILGLTRPEVARL
jgi:RimJ/RimL family protein N-acetyltransferase